MSTLAPSLNIRFEIRSRMGGVEKKRIQQVGDESGARQPTDGNNVRVTNDPYAMMAMTEAA